MVSAIPSKEYPDIPKNLVEVLLYDLPLRVSRTFYQLACRRYGLNFVNLDFKGMSLGERRTYNEYLRELQKVGLIIRINRNQIMISPRHLIPKDYHAALYIWEKELLAARNRRNPSSGDSLPT